MYPLLIMSPQGAKFKMYKFMGSRNRRVKQEVPTYFSHD